MGTNYQEGQWSHYRINLIPWVYVLTESRLFLHFSPPLPLLGTHSAPLSMVVRVFLAGTGCLCRWSCETYPLSCLFPFCSQHTSCLPSVPCRKDSCGCGSSQCMRMLPSYPPKLDSCVELVLGKKSLAIFPQITRSAHAVHGRNGMRWCWPDND